MVWLTQPRRQLRTPGFFYLKAKIKKNKINKKIKRTRASLLEKKMTRNIFIFLPGLLNQFQKFQIKAAKYVHATTVQVDLKLRSSDL